MSVFEPMAPISPSRYCTRTVGTAVWLWAMARPPLSKPRPRGSVLASTTVSTASFMVREQRLRAGLADRAGGEGRARADRRGRRRIVQVGARFVPAGHRVAQAAGGTKRLLQSWRESRRHASTQTFAGGSPVPERRMARERHARAAPAPVGLGRSVRRAVRRRGPDRSTSSCRDRPMPELSAWGRRQA